MSVLCIECRYCRSEGSKRDYHFCDHPANQRMSIVDGLLHCINLPESCRERAGHCTPDGKHFAPRLEAA